jgi:hypothetical protein
MRRLIFSGELDRSFRDGNSGKPKYPVPVYEMQDKPQSRPITNPLGLAIMKCSFLKGAGVTLSLTIDRRKNERKNKSCKCQRDEF